MYTSQLWINCNLLFPLYFTLSLVVLKPIAQLPSLPNLSFVRKPCGLIDFPHMSQGFPPKTETGQSELQVGVPLFMMSQKIRKFGAKSVTQDNKNPSHAIPMETSFTSPTPISL